MSKRRDRLIEKRLVAWLDSAGDDIVRQAEAVPLHRDMDTLLRLIKKIGLTWTAQNLDSAAMFLRGSIKRMVIDILARFGSAECEYRDKPLGIGTIPELVAFEITPLGDKLLKALAITGGLKQI